MFSNMTREQVERSLTCGKNYRPKEITGCKFYFFKGYIIEILENGGFYLSKRHMYYSNRPSDTLKFAMDEIIKIKLKDFDREENLRKQIEKEMLKRISPLIQDLVQEVLDKQGE